MQDVLAEAGLSAGGVYRYFASKEEIIVAIGQENLASVVAGVKETARVHGEDGPGAVLAAWLDYVRENQEKDHVAATSLLVWAESLRNDVLTQGLKETFHQIRGALVETMSRTDLAGEPDRPDAAENLGTLMVSVICGYLLELIVLPPEVTAAVPDAVRATWPPRS